MLAMADLGVKKGYTLVEVGEYKMFFVANELASLLTTLKNFKVIGFISLFKEFI